MEPNTFVFFGIVGSGKGTQVKLLQEFLQKAGKVSVYIGTGEIFRKIVESSGSNPDTLMVKDLLNSGRLISDEMTNKLVTNAVESELLPEKDIVFDGYPRTIPQAEYFRDMIKSHNRKEIKIVYIELSENEAMRRNLLRGRQDDTPEGLKKRFDEYINKVVPAMNYFKDKDGYTIYTINGEQPIENVHQDIIKALNF